MGVLKGFQKNEKQSYENRENSKVFTLVKKIENLERIIITGNNIDLYNNKEQEDDIIDEINDIFDNIF